MLKGLESCAKASKLNLLRRKIIETIQPQPDGTLIVIRKAGKQYYVCRWVAGTPRDKIAEEITNGMAVFHRFAEGRIIPGVSRRFKS